MTTRVGRGVESRLASRCAAIASAGAAAIHLGVAPAHWQHWVLSGVFFASIGLLQLVWAILAWLRPTALILAAGIVANAGAIALWVHSRTIGVPFGPGAGEPEAVDAAGISVLLLQFYVVMGAAWAWLRCTRAQQVSGVGRALVLLGANGIVAAAVTAGLVSSLSGHGPHDHGPAEAQSGHQVTRDAPVPGHHSSEPSLTGPAPADPGRPMVESSLDTDGHHDHHG
ncbi:hypothetical protein BayCH28_05190 [Mycolicibacterium sp. CH28]|uniref:hypothetical protein n=1 Tax=Mycolicibacterium sp. CH28 TaxID=2512237 RepID=UPI0010806B65|nr:hypothetical protein [Mycolicibacterium sp. CH28]TGD89979.1 hypothetical protein BayCH28_05190 [Mycolicibacterium sp. CH28]